MGGDEILQLPDQGPGLFGGGVRIPDRADLREDIHHLPVQVCLFIHGPAHCLLLILPVRGGISPGLFGPGSILIQLLCVKC